jgi:hypothetical protein
VLAELALSAEDIPTDVGGDHRRAEPRCHVLTGSRAADVTRITPAILHRFYTGNISRLPYPVSDPAPPTGEDENLSPVQQRFAISPIPKSRLISPVRMMPQLGSPELAEIAFNKSALLHRCYIVDKSRLRQFAILLKAMDPSSLPLRRKKEAFNAEDLFSCGSDGRLIASTGRRAELGAAAANQ